MKAPRNLFFFVVRRLLKSWLALLFHALTAWAFNASLLSISVKSSCPSHISRSGIRFHRSSQKRLPAGGGFGGRVGFAWWRWRVWTW